MYGEPFSLQRPGWTNSKHIQTMGELDEYEEQNIAEGIAWLKKQQGEWSSYEFWMTLHKRLFGDVWDWAGKIRQHELNNPDFHARGSRGQIS